MLPSTERSVSRAIGAKRTAARFRRCELARRSHDIGARLYDIPYSTRRQVPVDTLLEWTLPIAATVSPHCNLSRFLTIPGVRVFVSEVRLCGERIVREEFPLENGDQPSEGGNFERV